MEQLRYNIETNGFRGIQTLTSDMTIDPKYAVEAYNVEFDQDSVLIPRRGMGRFYDLLAQAGCRSSTSWQNDHGHFILFFGIASGSGTLYAIKNMYSASPSVVTIASGLNATHVRFAAYGNQLLIACLNDLQQGSDAARVLTYDGTNFTLTQAFPYPMPANFTTSLGFVSGFATLGQHWIGYVPEYVDGHLGKASPDTATGSDLPTAQTFEPIEATVVTASPDGGGTITCTFTSVAWPSNVRAIHMIMTPVTNSFDFYFVPGGRYTVPSGTTSTLVVNITESDTELLRQQSAVPHIYHYTGAPLRPVPFLPHNVCVFGRRACWVTDIPTVTSTVSVILVSEIDNPQAVRIDTGLVKMPDGGDIKAAIGIDNSLLIGGSSGIAIVQDTQSDPVTWPVRYIDESRGVITVNGFLPDKSSPSGQNESASSKCWVVTEAGIIHTSGTSIPPRTLCESFRENWWDRINWKYGGKIQVVDWPERFVLMLLVPLDGANEPTHVFCFHYFLGKSENQINFHVMQVASYRIGTMTMAHNANPFILQNGNYRDELFTFSYDPSQFILRAKDEGDYDPIRNRNVVLHTDDVTTPYTEKINALYVTSARPKLPSSMNICGPLSFHVSGRGKLKPYGITYPRGKQYDYRTIDMSLGIATQSHRDGASHMCTKIVRCTGIRFGFEMLEAGDWCLLQSLTTWHEPVTMIPGSYRG